MKCTFTVGQKVVCINDDWTEWALLNGTALIKPCPARVPMINEVLTIREIIKNHRRLKGRNKSRNRRLVEEA